MFKKDLTAELNLQELRIVKESIMFSILNNKELDKEKERILRALYQKVLYD